MTKPATHVRVVALIAGLSATGIGLPASGSAEAGAGGGIDVRTHFTDPGLVTGLRAARCAPVVQPGVCELEFRGHSTSTGTMTGWSDYTIWGHGNPDGSLSFYADETFTGAVAGCGRGTFEFVLGNGRVEADPQNPALQHEHADWSLVPASGTGDLRRLRAGNGVEDGVVYPDTSNEGLFTGTLSCRG